MTATMKTWLLAALFAFSADTFCDAGTFQLTIIPTFNFFANTAFREPTDQEISGLETRSTEFYRAVYAGFYAEAGSFNSLTPTSTTATTNSGDKTVTVEFQYVVDISPGPSIQDVQAVAASSNRWDYVWSFVWKTETTDLFYNVDAGTLPRNFNVTAIVSDAPTAAPVEPDPAPTLCFSGPSTVQVLGEGSVPMTKLHVGDRILTSKNQYEPVYAFGHYSPGTSAEFLQIHTNTPKIDGTGYERPLEVTKEHLIFIDGKKNPVRADSINVGDALLAQGLSRIVTKVNRIKRNNGVYNPLTPSGSLIVDGIAASSYVSFQDDAQEYIKLQGGFPTFISNHDFVHLALSPFRLVCMNVASSRLCDTYNEQGLPSYVSWGIEIIEWIMDQNIVLQGLALTLFLLVGGSFCVVEQIVGASGTLATLAVLAAIFKFASVKAKKKLA